MTLKRMGMTVLTTATLLLTGCAATQAEKVAPEVEEETFKIVC